MFSSLGPKTTFQPFVPSSRNVIDLTKDSDGFDPDAALRDNKFGAVDPYTYIDPSKASGDIKALLEGAFDGDDDEDKPKTRLRNRAKKNIQVSEKKVKSLADKLADLDVKDEKLGTEETSGGAEADDEDEEDGTVDGLTVKLLPHQVEGGLKKRAPAAV